MGTSAQYTLGGTTINQYGTVYYGVPVIDFDIMDIQSKDKHVATGPLNIIHEDEKDGLYIKLADLHLPVDLKEVFSQIKNSGGYNLWQIRSPISLRIDFQFKEKAKHPHFFTLASLSGLTAEESTIILKDPIFQEVTDQLELIRLVEIQSVFTKLLRRL